MVDDDTQLLLHIHTDVTGAQNTEVVDTNECDENGDTEMERALRGDNGDEETSDEETSDEIDTKRTSKESVTTMPIIQAGMWVVWQDTRARMTYRRRIIEVTENWEDEHNFFPLLLEGRGRFNGPTKDTNVKVAPPSNDVPRNASFLPPGLALNTKLSSFQMKAGRWTDITRLTGDETLIDNYNQTRQHIEDRIASY